MPVKVSWSTCLKVGVSVFALYLCIHFWPAIAALLGKILAAATPLFIGCAAAYILNILMSAYEKRFFPKSQKKAARKLRRPLCLIGAIVTLAAIVTLVVWLVVPQLVSCVQLIIDQVPGFVEDLVEKGKQWGILSPETIGMLDADFDVFMANLHNAADPCKAESLLPTSIDTFVKAGKVDVKVYPTESELYGVTYKEDKPWVVNAIQSLIDAGEYPEHLWG